MNVALRQRPMTREEFFAWAERREEKYEFDGTRPVLMVRTSINHGRIARNILVALIARLRGTAFEVFGTDVGVSTLDQAVRYPDILISSKRTPGKDYLVQDVVAVFEVVSPGNSRNDRIVKVQEYLANPSIQTYVIAEQDFQGITVLRRDNDSWVCTALSGADTLVLSSPALSIPVAEFYADVDVPPPTADED